MSRKRIFISVANREHEDLRADLRDSLTRAGFDVVVQPDFPHTATDTVRKLDDLIAPCDLVLHIVGKDPGSTASSAAAADFFRDKSRDEFLAHLPDAWTKVDVSQLTYFQWEPWLALHRKIDVLVYGIEGHQEPTFPQRTHLDTLRIARKHAETLKDEPRRCGQIVADVCVHFGIVPGERDKLAPSRLTRHAARNFFGREQELELIDNAWADSGTHVLSLVAWGGVGKTALVTQWLATRMIAKGWPGVERYFDWSFYSQGTGETRQTSSDLFINEALKFFGDSDPTLGTPWERGERLAGLIRQHQTLLVLDGIEPLQYPPTDRSGQAGRLKDNALESLLQSLAQDNHGLCIVTSREHLTNIDSFPTQQEYKLEKLMLEAAIGLIRHLQLIGTDQEIKEMWDALDGHALSILQLGRLLARGYGKDLRKWRELGITKADKLHQGRSTMKVMAKYESWLLSGDKERQLELAILRLTGLFEKPMSPGCFEALRTGPTIAGLTELFGDTEAFEVEAAVTTLIENELLSHGGGDDYAGSLLNVPLDAHPLIREYFAAQLQREQPEAFQAAHSRLFDFLCNDENTPHRPDGLDGLAPLYEAVTHGCVAGRHQEACDKVYVDRILRGMGSDGFYSGKKLGAIGADLAAVAAFFLPSSSPVAWASRPCEPSTGGTPVPRSESRATAFGPWSQVSPNLTAADQAWLLNEAAYSLRALGRLTEALQPMRAGLEMAVRQEHWKNAAIRASNLSELELTLGRLPDAVTDARQSITHADQSGDAFQRMSKRETAADALHQSGQRAAAGTLFAEAERMQQEMQPQFDLLYSVGGFRYCDWLLAPAEQAAWQHVLRSTGVPPVEGFHGRDAHATGGFRIRRGANLPHWRQNGAIYAVTFRLADSVPNHVLNGWRVEREELVKAAIQKSGQLTPAETDRLQMLFSEKVEQYLNQRQGACWMMRDDVALIVQNALLHFEGSRYDLFAWCVMPNHVHVVVRPRPGHSLESILHSWKSFTSKQIGRLVGKTGTLWQSEYYDHLVRDEQDLIHAMEYVLNNPQAAGLENWSWVGHRGFEEEGRSTGVPPVGDAHGRDAHATLLADVERRATTTLGWVTQENWLLDIALDHLTLARVGLIRAILANPLPQPKLDLPHVAAAVNGLRASGDMMFLPLGLLTAALYHFVRGEYDVAHKHLAEAQQIVERGPMPLFLADIHLTRARLFHDRDSLTQAATLIHTHGYARRTEELATAEAAPKDW